MIQSITGIDLLVLSLAIMATLLLGFTADASGQEENGDYARATFAGGCFWCMEPPFENLEGVQDVISGYSGGTVEDPTYEQVSRGKTGHREAIHIRYDPEKISYPELLEVYWRHIDPTDPGGQFADRGTQYTTAIFYHDETQRSHAEESKQALEKSGRFEEEIVTEIVPFESFYPAEQYHQDYAEKNPARYNNYKTASGRPEFIQENWSTSSTREDNEKPKDNYTDEELREMLTPLQYRVTQENGTERPFQNKYWDNKAEGIYVDIVSGEPLFSSTHKFRSGSGWPSFYRALEPDNVVTRNDKSLGMTRTEVRSKRADSHLGHLFMDGPEPTGKRYCINSAALEFIPKSELVERGYEEYLELFES